ncbi:uncharacterized protein LOC18440814 isoform X1 [Amborella trichopoda]|uniref:uncharacterized protein LOC18440814 isoform X1 n=1 Tax=Amborella trichopoda TaxID=13333 RepID=UPI0005D2F8A7|nr:uncharacterized protein LOC18440814 isoform X1 [Amborella trichopoda]|eukprot:XP_011625789.1 uncharacterized protein LOC18440814 isoform X1 [Amborella trichopoda]
MDRDHTKNKFNYSSSVKFSAFFLLLIGASFLVPASGSSGPGKVTSKSGGSSVFSLFNLKGKSRFWSDSVIHGDFDDLEASESSDFGKMSVLNYTKAGSIASYLKLQEVDSMYLPVPVNFIFIGFEGKGNHEFKLGSEELEKWFTKIDHIFEHTRVPQVGEALTPFYKISLDGSQRHHLPLLSHVNYNFSVHAIQMGEKVTSVFEHAIRVLSHKENVSDNRPGDDTFWQVDMDRMSFLFASLVDYLELENAYNIFILNPKHENARAKYGYRRGLSESDINLLKEDASIRTKLLRSEKVAENLLENYPSKRPLYAKHPMLKFAWTTAEDFDTSEWSSMCLAALREVETLYQGKTAAEVVYSKSAQILHGKNEDMKLLLEKELRSGELAGLYPECLTDTWIGKDRWAFIDLSAGPFSWGPTVGGEGVRTELSLPNVGKTIGVVAEITEAEAENKLQDAIQEKFAVFGDQEQDHHAIDVLLAEIDIYELFAFKHCKGRKVKLALCEELDERMRDLKTELQNLDGEEYDESHKRKAIDALKRMENWNLFSDVHEHFQNYNVARDSFLAHLGATLWSSMRHIISPSTADGAYHYYEKISFQLFFITQEKVRNTKNLPVELKAVMDAFSSLLVPSQKVQFSTHMLALSDDPALAMAFSVARRAAAVPLLLVNGTYRSTVRGYLDSLILQHQLQRLSDSGSLKGAHSHSRSTLEVPIFWFIHNELLLVDKHFQAKALPDMVIVVQSNPSSWESHLQCNGQSLLWDLRRPIKAAMAATAEHLAGLLPLHLVYSHTHESAIQDWIWSVGCNAFSVTSQGWHISRFHSDTIARSYIVTALDESIQVMNDAIRLLVMERTTAQTFKLFKSQERNLVSRYNSVVSLWRRIATVSGELRYGDALNLLYMLEDASKGFMDAANATIASLHPIHCRRQRKVQVDFDLSTLSAFLVVFAVLWFVLRPRKPKAKIN